jgi:hypothetical protein
MGEGEMILTEQKYRAERGRTAETYQGFTVTMEMEQNRNFITVELDNLTRWRSTNEYADYLRWVADELENIGGAKI